MSAQGGGGLTRIEARQILEHFLRRVRQVRGDPDILYRVERAILFGSYLDPEVERPDDVDVAIRWAPKHPRDEQLAREQAQVRAAREAGIHFIDLPEELFYPIRRMREGLTEGLEGLSLHLLDLEGELVTGARSRVLVREGNVVATPGELRVA